MNRYFRIYYTILCLMSLLTVILVVRMSGHSFSESDRKQKESVTNQNEMNVGGEDSGNAHESYINRMEKEVTEMDAAMNYIDFQKENWNDLFEIRKKVLMDQYLEDVPDKIPLDGKDPKYSQLQIHDTKQGYYILLLHNVCYDLNRGGMSLFVKNTKDIDLSVLPKNFPSGWGFNLEVKEFPDQSTTITDTDSYMFIPHSSRNIAHFMEIYNFIYHLLHQPHHYPHINKIYYPTMDNKQTYLWIHEYKEIALSLFPKEMRFQNIFREAMMAMSSNGLLCYRRLLAPSRLNYIFYGGIFISPTEVETVRAAAYKYFNLDPVRRDGYVPHVVLMTRSKVAGNLPGRSISNQDELTMYMRRSKSWFFSEVAMELLTPTEQAATMLRTDVLIGVLGSGFANIIFMLPGSVAVSFSPAFVGGFFFSTMAEFCQIRYIPVYNYSIVPPNECNGYLGPYGEMKTDSEYCLSTLYTANIYFNVGTISSIMRQAFTHLRMYKFNN